MPSTEDLIVSVAPLLDPSVEYYEQVNIPLTITSNSGKPIIIESITLRFQTDGGMPDYDHKQGVGKKLLAGALHAENIYVTPVPEFLETTCTFQIKVRYRKVIDGIPGEHLTIKTRGSYIIVHPCKTKLGQLFISFKQPDDLPLARLFETVARRAGFQPYVKMDESNPGSDMWEIIEPRIKESEAIAFLWTDKTDWGEGVAREIQLAIDNGIHYIPLIEETVPVPPEFRNSAIEYQKFHPELPLPQFSKAVTGLREVVMKKRDAR